MNIYSWIIFIFCIGISIWCGMTGRTTGHQIRTLEHVVDSLQREIIILEHSNIPDVIIQRTKEQGFFEGQRAAINKDIRIVKGADSCWHWVSSPNKLKPLFWPEDLGKVN